MTAAICITFSAVLWLASTADVGRSAGSLLLQICIIQDGLGGCDLAEAGRRVAGRPSGVDRPLLAGRGPVWRDAVRRSIGGSGQTASIANQARLIV